jgi:hypothetical protein
VMAPLTPREQASFLWAVLNKLHFDDFRGGAGRDFFRWSHQHHYTTVELDRPALPLRIVERKCARLDAASTSPSALAPWRCGARQPTIGLGQTADGSPFGRVNHVKYVSAAPSGAVASRRRPIATCRQWAPSRPGVTSAANPDQLRSNTARYGSLQDGLGALGSGGLLHTTHMWLGRVGSAGVSVAAALLVPRGAPGAKSRRSAPICPVKPAIRPKLSTS